SGKVASKFDGANDPQSLDELSTLGENTVAEFYQEKGFSKALLSPEHFPIQKASLEDLLGGSRETNATIVRNLLGGQEKGPRRDAVLLNAAAALFVANRAASLSAGWELAATILDSGDALKKLREIAGEDLRRL